RPIPDDSGTGTPNGCKTPRSRSGRGCGRRRARQPSARYSARLGESSSRGRFGGNSRRSSSLRGGSRATSSRVHCRASEALSQKTVTEYEVRLSEPAEQDIESIFDYLF